MRWCFAPLLIIISVVMLIYIVHIIVMIVIQMFLMNLLLREDSHVVRLYISYSIDCGGSEVDFFLYFWSSEYLPLYSWLFGIYYKRNLILVSFLAKLRISNLWGIKYMTNLYNKGLAASKKSERNEPDKSYQFNGGNTFESLRSRFNSVSRSFEGSSLLELIFSYLFSVNQAVPSVQ